MMTLCAIQATAKSKTGHYRRRSRPRHGPGCATEPKALARSRLAVARLRWRVGVHEQPEVLAQLDKRPEFVGDLTLRVGFLTSAARRGASIFKMRDVSRHKSMDVLQGYVRDADLFHDHAGAGLL
jgi:hypothetical protein